MRVIIDGDGCPVKDCVIELAEKRDIFVVIVTSIKHFSTKDYPKHVSFIYVDHGRDSADYKIVQLVQEGDLLVTQDYGLAALVLPKNIRVLHQLGYEYTKENIESLLDQRFIHAKLRKNGIHTKGAKPFTENDRQNFYKKITEIVEEQKLSN